MNSNSKTPRDDTAAQRRIDSVAQTDDPTKEPGDTSQLTPDRDMLQTEQPIETTIEKTFPAPEKKRHD